MLIRPHDKHRAFGFPQDFLGDAAQQHVLQRPVTVTAEHNQVAVFSSRVLNDFLERRARNLFRFDRTSFGAVSADERLQLLHDIAFE